MALRLVRAKKMTLRRGAGWEEFLFGGRYNRRVDSALFAAFIFRRYLVSHDAKLQYRGFRTRRGGRSQLNAADTPGRWIHLCCVPLYWCSALDFAQLCSSQIWCKCCVCRAFGEPSIYCHICEQTTRRPHGRYHRAAKNGSIRAAVVCGKRRVCAAGRSTASLFCFEFIEPRVESACTWGWRKHEFDWRDHVGDWSSRCGEYG